MQKEDLIVIWSQVKSHLDQALPEVSELIGQKFAQVEGKPEPGSDLDQVGLSNGAEVVEDYIKHNELGLALEHLCYMIEETNLSISAETRLSIKAAGQAMQKDVLRKDTMP